MFYPWLLLSVYSLVSFLNADHINVHFSVKFIMAQQWITIIYMAFKFQAVKCEEWKAASSKPNHYAMCALASKDFPSKHSVAYKTNNEVASLCSHAHG